MKDIVQTLLLLAAIAAAVSCSRMSGGSGLADDYNDASYAYHYKNLDSAMHYARLAAAETDDYDRGLAEALNNKAFVYIQRMQYDSAQKCLDEIILNTDNQIELSVADVQNMRLCQRRSQNKEFYDYREKAGRRLRRIEEEQQNLSERLLDRLVYAHTEFSIVNSVYYYYVGMERRSVKALSRLDNYKYLRRDTAQFLNYLFQKGTQGRMSEARTEEEMRNLMRCYFISSRNGYVYWKANALQMIAECMASDSCRSRHDIQLCATLFDLPDISDDIIAGYLADQALGLFMEYGDTYQVAGTYRTLAACYLSADDYESALFCLDKALRRDTLVNMAPDLVAGIREMMSVTYSAMGDKQASDYNRNIYLDLQEMTRQDRKFEARAEKLDTALAELNIMIAAVVMMIIVMVVLLAILRHKRISRNLEHSSAGDVSASLDRWKEEMAVKEEERNTRYEETGEKYNMERLKVVRNKRRAADNRAKISLAETVSPLIDRMLNEVERARMSGISADERARRLEYVSQIADKINDYNTVLTQWIELRRGMIGMNIESFALQDVFDTVSKGSMAFALRGITLEVESTAAVLKADKVLTLFMINTIADNARKHTARGGKVSIAAQSTDAYTDISVTDSGCGMSKEELAGVFSRDISGGHGFGLVNCKGIIEKYRKTSRIFSCCTIKAESEKGRGSRFTFRLPNGVLKMLAVMLVSMASLTAGARVTPDSLAASYADSVYYSNIEGSYHAAVSYADSVVKYVNKIYRSSCPGGTDTVSLRGQLIGEAAEIRWLQKKIPADYTVILDMRNEVAVAALAVHDTGLYKYNNKAYTSLFKELSSDRELPQYCRTMQQSKQNKTVAVILLSLLLVSVFPAYYFFYYRHVISHKLSLDKISEINRILREPLAADDKLDRVRAVQKECSGELSQKMAAEVTAALEKHIATTGQQMDDMQAAEDEFARAEYENDRMYVSNSITDNCLSTLKHETMYYPARIGQLVRDGAGDTDTLVQLVEYYRDIYNILMMQAMQQTNSMVFENRRVSLSSLLRTDTDLCTTGDGDVLAYMFEILRRQSVDGKFEVHVSDADDRYVVVETVLRTPGGASLFLPVPQNIPYLLCRSIVRDHSEVTGLRGCGINTVAEGADTRIIIKLTRNKTR